MLLTILLQSFISKIITINKSNQPSSKQLEQNQKMNSSQQNKQKNLISHLYDDQKKLKDLRMTNHVLIDNEAEKKGTKNIYLPGYLRMKVKNFTQIDLENLDAQINASLIFNIYYGQLLEYLEDPNLFDVKQVQAQAKSFKQLPVKLKRPSPASKQSQLGKSKLSEDKKDLRPTQNQVNVITALTKQIILNFPRDEALLLASQSNGKKNLQTKIKLEQGNQEVKYTVRKLFSLYLEGQLLWSPIQEIHSILQITVQPVQVKIKTNKGKQQKWNIKINLMDLHHTKTKISYNDQLSFGNYSLIKSKLKAFYSNKRVTSHQQFYLTLQERRNQKEKQESSNKQNNSTNNANSEEKPSAKPINFDDAKKLFQDQNVNQNKKKQDDKKPKIESFQHAHFNIPLYKDPLAALVTIFLPLWLLAIINLGIFFQDVGLGDRIGSISALMIAFVAFIPTIRQQIPPNPKIIIIQYLIYFQTGTCLLALLHSMNVRNMAQLNFVWYQSGQYLTSVIITLICIVFIIIQIIYHYCWRVKQFNKLPQENNKVGKQNQNKQNKILPDKSYQRLNDIKSDKDGQSNKKSQQDGKSNKKQDKEIDYKRFDWSNKICDQHYLLLFRPILEEKYSKIHLDKPRIDLLFKLEKKKEK